MKIKHTLKLGEGKSRTISGRITDVEWGRNYRYERKRIFNKDNTLFIESDHSPQLLERGLFIRGDHEDKDNRTISHTYPTKAEAQAMMDFINEHTVEEKILSNTEDTEKAIHCETKEQFIEVQKILFKKGRNWLGCDTKEVSMCGFSEGNDCIDYQDAFCSDTVSYNKKLGYTIISYKEFLEMEGAEEKREPKRGDNVLCRFAKASNWVEEKYISKTSKGMYVTEDEMGNVTPREQIKQIKETITIDGKKYLKSDVEKLKEVE